MITEKTVFILGAGASCPYGFPSGAQLRKIICHHAGFTERFIGYCSANKHVGNTRIDVQKFIKSFDRAHTSIDRFLAEKNSIDAAIGKYIIAFEIFEAERQSHFGEKADEKREYYNSLSFKEKTRVPMYNGFYQGGNWYLYIYNQQFIDGLAGKKSLPDFSCVSFITFNYDRSLEHFLYDSLCHLYSEFTKEQIVQCMDKLKIIHVYGKTAPLDWQSQDGICYGAPNTEELLQKAAQNIKTIHEERRNLELEEAKKLIAEAKRLFFLGFGYAPENMEILGLPQTIRSYTWVYGTGFGLERREVEKIHSKIYEGIKIEQHHKHVIIEDMDCLKLLRNYL